MNCRQVITHTVREGDSLYTIAQSHQIPLEVVIAQNPGLDPYNLQVGTVISICMDDVPGHHDSWESMNGQQNMNGQQSMNGQQIMELSQDMRQAWLQHVYWNRMLLISIAERLGDQAAVTARLMKNPEDIAEIYGEFYPPEVAGAIKQLLTEHLGIGGELITAVRDQNQEEVTRLSHLWYENADQIAQMLSAINPQYQYEELRSMLYHHLSLLQKEISARLMGNYEADIQAFDEVEEQAADMADYLAAGLIRQFPQKF